MRSYAQAVKVVLKLRSSGWSANEDSNSALEMFVAIQEFLRMKDNRLRATAELLEIESYIAQYMSDALQSVWYYSD